MDAIEQAIRNAFAKGDPEDPVFREKVYRSASAALEKALQANDKLAPEAAERRRKHLLGIVTSVESEFVPAVDPVSPPAPSGAPTVDGPAVDGPAADARGAEVPHVVTPDAPAPRTVEPVSQPGPAPGETSDRARDPALDWSAVPSVDRPVLAGDTVATPESQAAAPAETPRSRRKGGRWGLVAGLVSFLVIVGLAVWIAAEAGLIGQSNGLSGSEAVSTSQSGADGAPRKPGEQEALENWIVVFSPDDPTTVAAAVGARAEVVEASGEKALRISSGTTGAAVRFDVGQGVLERIAGRQAVFDIVAKTGDGPETQISVSCDFGVLGDCGRNRYIVNTQRAEFLLQVDVPAGTPTGGGVVEIQSDLDNGGKSVEIVQIRVNPGTQ